MRLPNFLVAGFPKCGSTSLHYYFDEHPDIFMPTQKELHFFTYDILKLQNKGKGDKEVKKFHIGEFSEYQKCYDTVRTEKAIGDASPSYANYASAIPKIKATLGDDVKIIIVLRDPVKRAYSNYLHLVREDREQLSFYEALLAEENRKKANYSDFWYYAFNSTYAEKVTLLKKEFKEVLIITFEEFIANAAEGIKPVYEFLNVNSDFVPASIDTHFNPGGAYKKNVLTKFIFKQSKFKSVIKKLIPLTPNLKKAKLKTIQRYKEATPEIDPKAEEYLVQLLKNDVAKLKTLGVKTELWNDKFFLN